MEDVFLKDSLEFPVSIMLEDVFQRLWILTLGQRSVSFEYIFDARMSVIIESQFNKFILKITS